jgi:hypothetical protein
MSDEVMRLLARFVRPSFVDGIVNPIVESISIPLTMKFVLLPERQRPPAVPPVNGLRMRPMCAFKILRRLTVLAYNQFQFADNMSTQDFATRSISAVDRNMNSL